MVNIALVCGLLVCSYTDYRYNRIYNWVTLPLIGFGLLVNGIYGRWPGFLSSLYGCIAASLPLYLAFLMGGMGGGDVKLMGAVGALKGVEFAVLAMVLSAGIGGLWALLLLVRHRKLISFLQWLLSGRQYRGTCLTLPYGIAISGGTLLALGISLLPRG
ncbi:MAG TPA: prepilin peptidase [Firmicutes bacterium]|nr:prepilin peptidase [Bacillota bacterium]